jgi:hypothetical protein
MFDGKGFGRMSLWLILTYYPSTCLIRLSYGKLQSAQQVCRLKFKVGTSKYEAVFGQS